ncbi:hypothetical protein K1T71_010642 [Dendrolimus kikuchii]|uniref:Uncharacterized protein n=1 Tax=Dendrolimus kikuchii TaxID=765133 RepID=A0ACC1CPG7_9NEOP|nr:hypothetical protein K1T71_010642 [Dendrolimus kikuchii]
MSYPRFDVEQKSYHSRDVIEAPPNCPEGLQMDADGVCREEVNASCLESRSPPETCPEGTVPVGNYLYKAINVCETTLDSITSLKSYFKNLKMKLYQAFVALFFVFALFEVNASYRESRSSADMCPPGTAQDPLGKRCSPIL